MARPAVARICKLVATATLVGSLIGCSNGADARGARYVGQLKGPDSAHALTWLFTERALNQVLVNAGARAQLDRARIFEIVRAERHPQTAPGLMPTITFPSYANMKQTIDSGALPGWVRAVLYDNEAWSFTPPAEQRAPGRYMAMAAELAHRHHLLFLASPSLSLARVLEPGVTPRADAYLQLRLPAQAAGVADVVNIQAQSLERSTQAYVEFVRKAAAQARRAKPGVTVLAGLSSNPTGAQVTAAQLTRAIAGVRPYVNGYWMNIPSPGPMCPSCNPARPDLAIAAIASLSG